MVAIWDISFVSDSFDNAMCTLRFNINIFWDFNIIIIITIFNT